MTESVRSESMLPSPARRTAVVVGIGLMLSLALLSGCPTNGGPATGFVGQKAGQTRKDNGLETTLVWIPPGEFTMGSPKGEKGRNETEDQVQVTLSRGFWMGEHEVTQAEWKRVMKTTPWTLEKRGQFGEFVCEGNDYPAIYVNWDDAIQFCEKLTQQERTAGRLPSDWQYTLPTEAQWEYACRGGTKSRYSFGDNESDLRDHAWWGAMQGDVKPKHEQHAQLVGRKKANPWGLRDMHGNVWEWCRDYYGWNLAGGTDPQGPPQGSGRVRRGGSWSDPAENCRSAARGQGNFRSSNMGFRVAAVPSGK